jgi:hypothetical protein
MKDPDFEENWHYSGLKLILLNELIYFEVR